jgi:hypothetical protein
MGSAQRSAAGGARRAAAHPPESRGLWLGCWPGEVSWAVKPRWAGAGPVSGLTRKKKIESGPAGE